jgi:hypothetical protein
MPQQSWVGLLSPAAPIAGAAYTVSATIATLSPVMGSGADAAQVAAPSPYSGSWTTTLLIRFTARGFITTTTTAGTLAFSLAARVGNAGSTYVPITGAHSTLNSYATAATTGIPWVLHGLARCTQIATSGNTVAVQAEMFISALPASAQTIATASAGVNLSLPSASGETLTAVDTTQIQGLSLRCVGSAASGTVQCTQWLVEGMS